MNKTLYQLAYRQIKKYKKHYAFVSTFIAVVSIIFLTWVSVSGNYLQVKKQYDQEHYGTWYFMADINEEDKEEAEAIIDVRKDIQFGYYYQQGVDSFYHQIGHVDPQLYEYCHLILVDGHYPQNDNEVMVSQKMYDEMNLTLNEKLTLTIQNQRNDYQIVGVIDNSQDFFPDIYTHIEWGSRYQIIANQELGFFHPVMGCYYFSYGEHAVKLYKYQINEFGYSAHQELGTVYFSNDQLVLIVEAAIFMLFALFVMNSTSFKKRTKEFALFRGIGMTTRQLSIMVLYEIALTTIFSLLLAIFVSVGTSYLVMLYFQMEYGYFVYQIHFINLLKTALVMLLGIMITSLIPIFSSAKSALTGSFDGRSFSYIQVRYRQLKYQNKWRLALRELKVKKKMTLSFLIVMAMISTTYIYSLVQFDLDQLYDGLPYHYLSVDLNDESELALFESLQLDNTIVLKNAYTDKNFFYQDIDHMIYNNLSIQDKVYCIDDPHIFEKCQIQGHVPQNSHEVLVIGHCHLYEDIHEMIFLQNGENFIVDNQQYTVTGEYFENLKIDEDSTEILSGGDRDVLYLPSGIYVMPEIYQQLSSQMQGYHVRVYYDSIEQKKDLNKKLKKAFKGKVILCSDDSFDLESNIRIIDIEPELLIFPAIVCLIFCYFLNKNQIINNKTDYAIYRLIGMTKKDLMMKQFAKAIWMTSIVSAIEILWIILLNIKYQNFYISIILVLISFIVVFIINVAMYCLPMQSLLKEDLMMYLKGDE